MFQLLPFVFGGILLVAVVAGAVMLLQGRKDIVEERLQALSETTLSTAAAPEAKEALPRRSVREQLTERLDQLIAGRGFAAQLRAQLRKADLKFTVGEYLIIHVACLALGGLFGYLVWGSPLLSAVSAVAGLFAPRMYVSTQQRRRLRAFDDQLPDTLSLWVGALRAGYSVVQAMETIARESPEPSKAEFRRVVMEMQIGISPENAFANMLARIESEDLDLVFTAVNVQREVGGNLAEILEIISHTIRERIRIKREIQVLTAQGRLTGYLIGLLPIFLSLLLLAISRDYMSQLFVGPPWVIYNIIPCGWPMIAIGLTMIAIGLTIIRRIVDIEV
jgi:tight adherence protein B